MSNIVLLEPPRIREIEDCKEAVLALLRELVVRAEAGEIVGLAYVTVSPDSPTGTGWTGHGKRDLSFGISLLDHRYHAACLE